MHRDAFFFEHDEAPSFACRRRVEFRRTGACAEDEAAAPIDHEDPLRGPVFGDMVHNVLERIDFAEVGRAAMLDDLFKPGSHARVLIDEQIRANIALCEHARRSTNSNKPPGNKSRGLSGSASPRR